MTSPMLGYKGFARCDEEGFVDKIHTTPANASESPQFGTIIDGAKAQRILAEKAYASKANRAALEASIVMAYCIRLCGAVPLRQSEKRFNKMIPKHRLRIEQCFGTMKRLFGLHRARYFGVEKTHAQMLMAAISQNLLKAANKIKLNPQAFAIA